MPCCEGTNKPQSIPFQEVDVHVVKGCKSENRHQLSHRQSQRWLLQGQGWHQLGWWMRADPLWRSKLLRNILNHLEKYTKSCRITMKCEIKSHNITQYILFPPYPYHFYHKVFFFESRLLGGCFGANEKSVDHRTESYFCVSIDRNKGNLSCNGPSLYANRAAAPSEGARLGVCSHVTRIICSVWCGKNNL